MVRPNVKTRVPRSRHMSAHTGRGRDLAAWKARTRPGAWCACASGALTRSGPDGVDDHLRRQTCCIGPTWTVGLQTWRSTQRGLREESARVLAPAGPRGEPLEASHPKRPMRRPTSSSPVGLEDKALDPRDGAVRVAGRASHTHYGLTPVRTSAMYAPFQEAANFSLPAAMHDSSAAARARGGSARCGPPAAGVRSTASEWVRDRRSPRHHRRRA